MAAEGGFDPVDDDLELDIDVRPAAMVADRLVALAAVARRAFLESGLPDDEEWDEDEDDPDDRPDDAETERYDLAAWLRDEGIEAALTDDERAIVETPIGGLDADAAARATWAGEALVALAWGAGLLPDLPPFDRPADARAALAALPEPWEKTAPLRSAIRLRSDEDAAGGRELAELWYWRAGVEGVRRSAPPAEVRELRAVIREAAEEAVAAGLLSRLAAGDFPAQGGPVATLSESALDDLATIAAARLRALNWLCGFGDGWDDVPLEI